MMNRIPEKRGLISSLGERILMGLLALGGVLAITQITAASFGVLLTAFNDALAAYNAARGSRQAASNLCKNAQKELVDWLKVVRGCLIADFGYRWNEMWASAGYVQPSTRTPRPVPSQLSLALQLSKFFSANPTYQVPAKDVTAAKATALRQAVLDAEDPLQTAQVTLKDASNNLGTAQKALTGNMSFLIKILSGTLGKNDPRWEAFGLNIPATQATPDAPTGLAASVMGKDIMVTCDVTALATRYRFRGKMVGVDNDYNLLASNNDPMALLQGTAGGITLEIIVQAVNGGSQGIPSEPILVTMPMPSQPGKADAEVELAPLASVGTNAKGSSNGNGSGCTVSRLS